MILIFSGGLDSTTLLYWLKETGRFDLCAVSFDYGQKHRREVEYARATCLQLGIPWQLIDMRSFGKVARSALTSVYVRIPMGSYAEDNMRVTVVPFRNSVMLLYAAALARLQGKSWVGYAAHLGDAVSYPDCRPLFVQKMNDLLHIADWESVSLYAPFLQMKKRDIISLGLGLGVDYELTYSCYNGGVEPCGACATCTDRAAAFWSLGMRDPLYSQDRWERLVVPLIALDRSLGESGTGDLVLPSTPIPFQIHSKENKGNESEGC